MTLALMKLNIINLVAEFNVGFKILMKTLDAGSSEVSVPSTSSEVASETTYDSCKVGD